MFVNFIVNYLFSFGDTGRITRQGFPTANTLAGMFLVTTLPGSDCRIVADTDTG